ncbi:MAG TPA: tetraacyldisaccharide 4'-kinase [Chitinophagaceae bacterium]|nr:tetraacyldisaccharide 4'-kinase [Chitinophagaceae bacterium]
MIRPVGSYLKYLLYPVSLLYGLIIWIRNKCYDWKILTAVRFDLPTIAVGNLTVGGSGKTPHVEYLIGMLKDHFHIATLSRGYYRRTRGYLLADKQSTVYQIGDEPMQFHNRFPEIVVAVGEDRMLALPQILMDAPETDLVLLDDAFQHRAVEPGLNILVTEFHRPFTRDHIVPLGRLRENRRGYGRADIILVTKCPPALTQEEKIKMSREIAPLPNQELFFTCLIYDKPYHIDTGNLLELSKHHHVLLVTGIADPKPLRQYLEQVCGSVTSIAFPDHHYYRNADLESMEDCFNRIEGMEKLVITTEKDAVRLKMILSDLPFDQQIFVQPIQAFFLFGAAGNFQQRIFDFLKQEQTEYEQIP